MMKPYYCLIFLVCAGCQLQEYRTTVWSKHIFSQEDSAFYFSDIDIKSRADSFELVRLGKDMKFYNAPDLSKSNRDEIRFLYDRSFNEPYLISLQSNGTMTIATIDTSRYEQYENFEGFDTLRFSPVERTVLRVNRTLRYYERLGKPDSAAMLKAAYGSLVDSLYDLHVWLLGIRQLKNDTIDIKTTTFYIQPTLFEEVLTKLDATNFWGMPVYEDIGASDGDAWTLEVKTGKRHHITCQVNMSNEPYEKICKMLLDYVHIPRKDIY